MSRPFAIRGRYARGTKRIALAILCCVTAVAGNAALRAQTPEAAKPTAATVQASPAHDAGKMSAPLDGARFQKNLAALTSRPNRLAGFETGSLAAAGYIQKQLEDMGFSAGGDSNRALFLQDVSLIQPRMTECTLTVDGQTTEIYAVRPNILQASVTPAEGISGQTLYVGKGETADYGRQLPQNKIVVMDFDSGLNWQKAFALGASAVIFVGGDAPAKTLFQHVNLPANLPRFYVTAAQAAKLQLTTRQQTVRIQAACEWKPMTGRNVIAVVRGTDPRFGGDEKSLPQAIVLAAPLDSYSEVPDLAPGARDAGNCAALLELADSFARKAPKRDMILVFLDGQSLNHMGARTFYGALFRQNAAFKAASYDTLQGYYQSESDFVQHVADVMTALETNLAAVAKDANLLGGQNLFTQQIQDMPDFKKAVEAMKNTAKNLDYQVLEDLRPLRLAERGLKDAKFAPGDANSAISHRQLEQISATVAQMDKEDKGWNKSQSILHEERWPAKAPDAAGTDLKVSVPGVSIGVSLFGKKSPDTAPELLDAASRMQKLAQIVLEQSRSRLVELTAHKALVKQSEALESAIGYKANDIVLHVSLNLSDGRNCWSFIHGDDTLITGKDNAGNYAPLFRVVRDLAGGMSQAMPNFCARAISLDYDIRLFAPALFADSSSVARLFQVNNLSLMTVLDPLARQGQPADTLGALDAATLLAQVQEAAPLLQALGDNPYRLGRGMTADASYDDVEWSHNNTAKGPMVSAGSLMQSRPVAGAVTAFYKGALNLQPVDKLPPGFLHGMYMRTNTNGVFEPSPYSTSVYQFPILFASTFDDRGLIDNVPGGQTSLGVKDNKLSLANVMLFRTLSKTAVGYGFERPKTQNTLAMRSSSTNVFPQDRSLLMETGPVTTLFAPYDARGLKLFNSYGLVLLNNNEQGDGYLGEGFSLLDPFGHPSTPQITAHDLRVLNEFRLKLLRRVRINQESLEILSGEAKDIEDKAMADLAQLAKPAPAGALAARPAATEPGEAGNAPTSQAAASMEPNATIEKPLGDLAASAAYSRRAYNPLVSVMNDLVTAVVLLLLLAMPFAYSLERLLIGTPHIYRQIAWFAVFFLSTFALLYLVNPAFSIAATPVIIFLAFTIILLSSLVIFIMVRKLQSELQKVQGLAMTVHSADVSRLSTMMAAVNMGISTMRRRPVRTVLTAATVVLLTFTILTFASFGSSFGVRSRYECPMGPGSPRVMVRHQLWEPIGEGLVETLKGHLLGEAQVVPRYWVSPTAEEVKDAAKDGQIRDLGMLAATPAVAAVSPVSAAIGLDRRDIAQEQLQDLFDGKVDLLDSDGIFLSDSTRKVLGLEDKDVGKAKVVLAGQTFTYAGVTKYAIDSLRTLDGSSMLPVDYKTSTGDASSAGPTVTPVAGSELADVQSNEFVNFRSNEVAIIPVAAAKAMGGRVRSLGVYPARLDAVMDVGERTAKITQLPTYASSGGEVYRMYFTTLASASGWNDLLIPVLLGGLIIFATMLGSVSDREKEIYTFSSLGLAPPHVASLFFAEASVYAVVGGMGGYLLGQVVARLLAWLSTVTHIDVPTMNYSSTNAIVTILIVMGTVLISTIYPATKASRSANPGIQRAWRIPKPVGNTYDLVFPFTVSAYDIIGVVSFLKEHFDNYSDTSLGVFATSGSRIFRQERSGMLGLGATVALAPFDLGVNQTFALLSQPSDIENIDEVRIVITRLSGAHGDWQRSNRVFINDLRKQLLIWRSLPEEVTEKYRQKTRELWAQLPLERFEASGMGEA